MKAKVKETGEIIDVKCLCSITYSAVNIIPAPIKTPTVVHIDP